MCSEAVRPKAGWQLQTQIHREIRVLGKTLITQNLERKIQSTEVRGSVVAD